MTETLEKLTMTPGISFSVIPAGAQRYHGCLDFQKTPCITSCQTPPKRQCYGVMTGTWVEFCHILLRALQRNWPKASSISIYLDTPSP